MPLSKNINTYIDVVQVLTAARERGGIVTYELRSKAAAVMWRLRAYYYRKLLTDAAIERAGSVRGFVPSTAWDDMLLEVDENKVRISFGRVAGRITDEEGKVLQPAIVAADPGAAEHILSAVELQPKLEAEPVLDPNLLAEAAALVSQHGDDDE